MRIAVFGNMEVEHSEDDYVRHYDIHNCSLDKKIDGLYDRVVMSNTIPELPKNRVMEILEMVYKVLRPRGELLVHVPLAEFACKQIFTNKATMLTYYMLYGNDDQPFRACYSLLNIRLLIERAGFIVRSATEAFLELQTTTGEKYNLPVHSLVATKYEQDDK